MAMAGLIIGSLGVLGSVLTYLGIVLAFGHTATVLSQVIKGQNAPIKPIQVVPVGQSINVSASSNAGISTVTVYSVSYPMNGSKGQPDPVTGQEHAVADIGECAGPGGSQDGPNWTFNLLFPNGEFLLVNPTDSTKQPALESFHGIGPNQCVRGYLTFEIAVGTTPTKIQFSGNHSNSNYEWSLL